MTDASQNAGQAMKQHAHHALAGSSPWIVFLARMGYGAKGVVYALVGVLAVLAAFGRGGQVDGSKSALATLIDEPGGQVLLFVIAVGLAGYALWCFVRAFADPEHEGTDAKGIGKRAISVLKGLIHLALVLAVLQMVFGWGSSGGGSGGGGEGNQAQDWTARVMSWPAGRWLVIIAGIAIAIYGLQQLYKAWTTDLDDQLDLSDMDSSGRQWTIRFARFGMGARGVVFVIIGGFLTIAGIRTDPQKSKGFGEAMRYVQEQPYGPWLLAVVALGLIAYGFYELVRARYRRIDPA